jgi:hypothetical protein
MIDNNSVAEENEVVCQRKKNYLERWTSNLIK